MRTRTLLLTTAILLAACGTPATTEHAEQGAYGSMGGSAPAIAERLNASPRHQEWVTVPSGNRTVHTWVVYPERSDPAPVVLLIHENRGLTDWVRSMADQVAEAGAIAVAPDLLSDFSATEKRTSDFATEDAARTALGTLDPERVLSDLQAVAAWAKAIPAGNGALATAGFCWGGARSFEFATRSDDLNMAMVFYGTGPTDPTSYAAIDVPVYGFYAGDDDRVNATIEASAQAMKTAGKTFAYEMYDGAGHAFMRSGEEPDASPANAAALAAAWERMQLLLSSLSPPSPDE